MAQNGFSLSQGCGIVASQRKLTSELTVISSSGISKGRGSNSGDHNDKHPTSCSDGQNSGFERIDLLVTLGILALLFAIGVPVLANNADRGDRITCMNNLRLIARAFHNWSAEHDDYMPWWVPSAQGGVGDHPGRHELWFLYSTVSNELRSPKVLVDPVDSGRGLRVAHSWGNSPNEGFTNPAFRDNSVSYFLGLHATPANQRTILTGDHNMSTSGRIMCLNNLQSWATSLQSTWTNALHGPAGNLAYLDGHVEETDTSGLQTALRLNPIFEEASRNTHFVFPP